MTNINIDTISDKFIEELLKNTSAIEASDLSTQGKITAFKTLIKQLNALY